MCVLSPRHRSAHEDHTVVRTKGGDVYTFGLGERGVLGHGHGDYVRAHKVLPTRVDLEPFFERFAGLQLS